MIPTFPKGKPLELADREEIIEITSKFPPFSDFNFVSMWIWNTTNDLEVSSLNKNLVLKFPDYDTGTLFFSFIGTQAVNETIGILLDHSKKELGEQTLKLIPEVVTSHVDTTTYNISADRDNFDYVFKIEDLRKLSGRKYQKRRNGVNSFLRTVTDVTCKTLTLDNKLAQAELQNLFKETDAKKFDKDSNYNPNLPLFLRLLDCISNGTFKVAAVYVKDKLVATLVNEIINDTYAVAHLMTADSNLHAGLYAYLMKQNAEMLHREGISFLNFEQDLGLQNLRNAKTLYRPASFLKKYQLSYLHKR